MLQILFLAGFIWSALEGFLRYYACAVIKRAWSHEAFLTSCALDVKDEAVCWKLLTRLDSQDVPWLDVCPRDWQEPFDFSRNHQVVDMFWINLVCHFPLSELKSHILDCGEDEVNDDQRDWELKRDLGIVLTDQDERDVKPEKKDFKVQEGVYK
jgi:hypothetical protein